MNVPVKHQLAGSAGGNQLPFKINDAEKFRVIRGSTVEPPGHPKCSHFIVAQGWKDPDPDHDATQKVLFAVQWLNDLLQECGLHFDVEVEVLDLRGHAADQGGKLSQLRVQCYRKLGEAR